MKIVGGAARVLRFRTLRVKKNYRSAQMKSIVRLFAIAAIALFAVGAQAQMRPVQTFDTSAGPVKITPVYH